MASCDCALCGCNGLFAYTYYADHFSNHWAPLEPGHRDCHAAILHWGSLRKLWRRGSIYTKTLCISRLSWVRRRWGLCVRSIVVFVSLRASNWRARVRVRTVRVWNYTFALRHVCSGGISDEKETSLTLRDYFPGHHREGSRWLGEWNHAQLRL